MRNTLAACHELLHTSGDASRLALDQRFCGEVVNAGVEAVGYEVGEHLYSILVSQSPYELLVWCLKLKRIMSGRRSAMTMQDSGCSYLLAQLQCHWFKLGRIGIEAYRVMGKGRLTPMNSFICLRSMRVWSSRCSDADNPILLTC